MKTVLITGACGGIGKTTALYFANKGWSVIATMLCLEEKKEFEPYDNIHCFALDVTSTASIETCKNDILLQFPKIDTIINNAGVGYRSFVELACDNEIERIVEINWLGVVKVCRAFIPVFREQKFGQFINITSIAGLVNLPLGSFYHSTKHAVESFSECMAYELLDFNISVTTVQFGNTPSNFQKNVVKSTTTSITAYANLMRKIDEVLAQKTKKNVDLKQSIVEELLQIAENPSKNFKRHTIGFDANFLHIARKRLGYQMFARMIRRSVFK
ncbi:SDR family NAD(P)-dependent oxidoreductase [Flavobacterium sp. UMI-01]|uniref:SDR family NAD(P)-dependent oxidoreductase n=1 Tax=Flavobacterium sp. UMI-01 TaxID=1441053 RepID=UPI001C7D36C3|nr:SDR family NAD(P)-dependent oxidoreductase [Flavobacterium sp. UMI-01]GIZ08291.1 short-chain dehydrogenase [Flavobacterium sp. UMI-01]